MYRERIASVAGVLCALAGTWPPAILTAVAIADHTPLALDVRFALGLGLVVPLWIAAMCLVFLIRRPAVAWTLCLSASALLSVLVPGAQPWLMPGS